MSAIVSILQNHATQNPAITQDEKQGTLQLRYVMHIKPGTQKLGYFFDPNRMPNPGDFEHTMTFKLVDREWKVFDSLEEFPVLPKDGLHIEGVQKWLSSLLKGQECNQLECISGEFYQKLNDNVTFTLWKP